MDMANNIIIDLGIQDNDVYSLDFAYCGNEKKRYLIEVNSAPGIRFPDEDIQYQHDFFHDLAKHTVKLINSK